MHACAHTHTLTHVLVSSCFSHGDVVGSSSGFLVRWSGSHIRWGQPFRLRHVTTGKYLSLMEDKNLLLMDKEKADVKSTAFAFRSSKVRWPASFWNFYSCVAVLFLWCWNYRKNWCKVFSFPASLPNFWLNWFLKLLKWAERPCWLPEFHF